MSKIEVPRGRTCSADGVRGIGEQNGARQRRVDESADGASGVHVLSADGEVGAAGLGAAHRLYRLDDRIDKFVIVGRFAFEIGDADDDGTAPAVAALRTVDHADDAARLDVEVLVRMARHSGHRHAAGYVGERLAQIDALDGDVGAALVRSQSRLKSFHLNFNRKINYYLKDVFNG